LPALVNFQSLQKNEGEKHGCRTFPPGHYSSPDNNCPPNFAIR